MGALGRRLAKRGGGPLIMDGGMGTTLEDRGIPVRSDLWSSVAHETGEGRALVREIHAEFRAAGAELLLANTHNLLLDACRAFLGDRGPGGEETPAELLDRLLAAAISDARAGAGEGPLVGAGIGSVEGPYATESRHSPAECAAGLLPSVRAVAAAGADLIVLETLTTREEIRAVADLGIAGELPEFAAGLTCGPGGRTLAGVPVEEAAGTLLPAGPEAIFVQCTAFDVVPEALAALVRAAGDGTIVGVYANDGRIWRDRRWHGERTSPEDYAAGARAWADVGARVIGGCCGTGPDHIRALVRVLSPS